MTTKTKTKKKHFYQEYRKGMDKESIKLSLLNHIKFTIGKDIKYNITKFDLFHALALTIRDRLIERWIETQQTYYKKNVKRVYYLSMEYLPGKMLLANIKNLNLYNKCANILKELNYDIEEIIELENEPGLGNGGLGRLGSCFLDSLATLEYPAYGYGIRYEFGIFKQSIKNGYQVENPDEWLQKVNPWEIAHPSLTYEVNFYGKSEAYIDNFGRERFKWVDYSTVLGTPYDMPISGFHTNTVNTFRLWSAKSSEEFDLKIFNQGDYLKAVSSKALSETISKVLYPSDNIIEGKELRLKQQYFFVSCSIQDIIRRHKIYNKSLENLPEKVAIQINDTHPVLVIPELMRILMDLERFSWEKAWETTQKVCSYTNHTLMPEALEKWGVALFGKLLPRHLQIIYEINRRFLREVSMTFPLNNEKLEKMSLIEEKPEKSVRMAYLAIVGSHKINGVAKLHTQLMKTNVFADFYKMYPEKFTNKTNGITHRRWLLVANPQLAELLSNLIGKKWITDLSEIKKIEKYKNDKNFIDKFYEIKQNNKKRLTDFIKNTLNITVDPEAIFDVHIKRIHEYKRQLLNALHIIKLYLDLKEHKIKKFHPTVFIFAGKAAPGYFLAKLIIKFINSIAEMINNDKHIYDLIKVVFIPDYKVSLAEKIIPAANVSEQISTAGTEASGTGNMKLALNGAITIGTLDGANIEIKKLVGENNIFIFGNTIEQIKQLKNSNKYNSYQYYYNNVSRIKDIIDLINSNFFSPEEKGIFTPIINRLLKDNDPFFHFADFTSYCQTHMKIQKTYPQKRKWNEMAIINMCNMGYFSSDRTIEEYAKEIWHLKKVKISL